MNVFIIIALVGLVALAWLWSNKSRPKNTPARTWPASRRKTGARPKIAPPL